MANSGSSFGGYFDDMVSAVLLVVVVVVFDDHNIEFNCGFFAVALLHAHVLLPVAYYIKHLISLRS